MPTIQESPTRLTIKSFAHTRRLILAIVLLLVGLGIVFAVPYKLLHMQEIALPPIQVLKERSVAPLSPGELLARLSDEGGRTVIRGQRPFLLAGFLSLIAGAGILFGYTTGQTVTFDKANRQISIKQPYRLFRTQTSHYGFDDLVDIRVERNRAFLSQGTRNYTVRLEFYLHDPDVKKPSDFVYKKWCLLSRYRLDHSRAQGIVAQISTFVGQGPSDGSQA